MAKVNHLLSDRLKKKEHDSAKMHALAERSSTGQLSGFAGVFQVAKLGNDELDKLKKILITNIEEQTEDLEKDFLDLIAITSEVKAISSQAIILHGERIKRAQNVLKRYRDGAFTEWLIHTYGNRQTPYNFLQYYEFHSNLSLELKEIAQEMPKQAIYTLASREADFDKKVEIIKSYKGETKQEMLNKIRKTFPLIKTDKRGGNAFDRILKQLEQVKTSLQEEAISFSKEEQKIAVRYLREIKALLN